MLKVTVQGDFGKSMIAGMQKQVRFATSVAINKTAKAVEDEERRAMSGGIFDRPKPATTKATYIKRSTKQDLVAEVGLKTRAMGIPAAEYLHPNVEGGARTYKRSELMLRQAGILPAGLYTVPGKEAQLDQWGNMSRGQIVQILSFFRTFGNTKLNSKRSNMTDKRRARLSQRRADYFVVPVRDRKLKLYPGIWQRKPDNTLAPVLMFVSKPQYRAIYHFGDIAAKVVRRTFQQEFDRAFAEAMRTAR
jgi:hypothetical protein